MTKTTFAAIALLLLGACTDRLGAAKGGLVSGIRHASDKKTMLLVGNYELGKQGLCGATAISLTRVYGEQRAREITEWCITQGLAQRALQQFKDIEEVK